MAGSGDHCSFVLLAEFHILEGAKLKYQFPQPLGVNEEVLAMSMLPDGAETQLDDWTIFFLNQTPFNTISPVLALDSPGVKSVGLPGGENDGQASDKPELLCVMNLVRTKHDKSLDRGAQVLALAICTRHPFIQIFKPFLLLALDDYLRDPSQDCLARLFDAVNSMDLSGAPTLTRHEKLVMRSSERKDIFAEKFTHIPSQQGWGPGAPVLGSKAVLQHKSTNSNGSYSSFEEGILLRGRDRAYQEDSTSRKKDSQRYRDRGDSDSVATAQTSHAPNSPSDSSFSLGGSAVWVGDESGLDLIPKDRGDVDSVASLMASSTLVGSSRKRRSTDASSSSSHAHGRDQNYKQVGSQQSFPEPHKRHGIVKDTHFYHTTVAYKEYPLPINMPLATFPEEVGDYSLITLIKVFSQYPTVSGPIHPHLHTNGPQTHPIIVLFNALVTGKRIIFLGHKRPAGLVSNFVLSACALGSGCGAVLRGFIERAFPYANLKNRDEWESVPAYIAGVTNPIFETLRQWDLFLDISTGSVTVAKDIQTTYPTNGLTSLGGPLITRSGTLKAESSIGSEEDISRMAKEGTKDPNKDNNADKLFIDDIRTAIDDHFGESLVRMRFTEYVTRFVRLASRYEEEITGKTTFGFPSAPFTENPGRSPKLGSGIAFSDEATCLKELVANAHRIEAWRKTNSYRYLILASYEHPVFQDYAKLQANSCIKGFDVLHQLFRLRYTKNMTDAEALAIMRSLADGVKTYDQVVELLASLPHGGGLMYLGFSLFHQKEAIRDCTVNLFDQLRAYPRYAYVRQAHAKEKRILAEHQAHTGQYPESNYSMPSMVNARTQTPMVGHQPNGAF
ncbi:hypothetical protein CVT25_015025 [Psilocybe cyanescens]|uniref:UDENN domain-containing protein n=1 Tax=Psilocybe cyanescens TaxID=93625 RepID=A0A409VPL9_PSICY|nr:hypothetical protein CVT25_015025 [Psilocybe cyanescens]